jgi:hypothetical protein
MRSGDGENLEKYFRGIGETGLEVWRVGSRGSTKIDAPHTSDVFESVLSPILQLEKDLPLQLI